MYQCPEQTLFSSLKYSLKFRSTRLCIYTTMGWIPEGSHGGNTTWVSTPEQHCYCASISQQVELKKWTSPQGLVSLWPKPLQVSVPTWVRAEHLLLDSTAAHRRRRSALHSASVFGQSLNVLFVFTWGSKVDWRSVRGLPWPGQVSPGSSCSQLPLTTQFDWSK